MLPRPCADAIWPPARNQIAVLPLEFAPQKVGVAVAVEVALPDDRPRDRDRVHCVCLEQLRPVHQPGGRVSGAITPGDVAQAVGVEIMSDGRHLPDGPVQHRERLEVGHEPSVQIVGWQDGAGHAVGRQVGAGRSIGDDVVQVGELGERIDHLIAVGPLPDHDLRIDVGARCVDEREQRDPRIGVAAHRLLHRREIVLEHRERVGAGHRHIAGEGDRGRLTAGAVEHRGERQQLQAREARERATRRTAGHNELRRRELTSGVLVCDEDRSAGRAEARVDLAAGDDGLQAVGPGADHVIVEDRVLPVVPGRRAGGDRAVDRRGRRRCGRSAEQPPQRNTRQSTRGDDERGVRRADRGEIGGRIRAHLGGRTGHGYGARLRGATHRERGDHTEHRRSQHFHGAHPTLY